MAKKGKDKESVTEVSVMKMKPTMHLEGDDCIDCKLGEEVTLKVKAKMTGDRLDAYDGNDTRSQSFEILGVDKGKEVSAKQRLAEMAQSKGKGMAE